MDKIVVRSGESTQEWRWTPSLRQRFSSPPCLADGLAPGASCGVEMSVKSAGMRLRINFQKILELYFPHIASPTFCKIL